MFKIVRSATNFVFAAQATDIATRIIPPTSPLFFTRPYYFMLVHDRLFAEEKLLLTKRLADETLNLKSTTDPSALAKLTARLTDLK